MAWTIDLAAGTATHLATGLVLAAARPAEGERHLDMAFRSPLPSDLPLDASALAGLSREGGEAFLAAVQQERRRWACEVGRKMFGAQWQSDLARLLEMDPRLIRRWESGERWPSAETITAMEELVRQHAALLDFLADDASRCWAPAAAA